MRRASGGQEERPTADGDKECKWSEHTMGLLARECFCCMWGAAVVTCVGRVWEGEDLTD